MTTTNSPVILVVDDSPDTVTMLNDTLDSSGYTVLVALNGTQALSVLKKITPDLILLDVMMPGKDGFEICREIKNYPQLRDIPVIFMTGKDSSEVMSSSFDAGAVDYIQKPIRLEELILRVRQHLERSRQLNVSKSLLDENGLTSFIAQGNGQIVWSTPKVFELLENCGYDRLALVTDFQPWLKSWLTGVSNNVSTCIHKDNPEIYLSLESKLESGLFKLKLTVKDNTDVYIKLQKAFGLTLRESEVLYWVAQGKSNKEMAMILNISPRTVNKHLETVFEKMMVENRTTAANLALKFI